MNKPSKSSRRLKDFSESAKVELIRTVVGQDCKTSSLSSLTKGYLEELADDSLARRTSYGFEFVLLKGGEIREGALCDDSPTPRVRVLLLSFFFLFH